MLIASTPRLILPRVRQCRRGGAPPEPAPRALRHAPHQDVDRALEVCYERLYECWLFFVLSTFFICLVCDSGLIFYGIREKNRGVPPIFFSVVAKTVIFFLNIMLAFLTFRLPPFCIFNIIEAVLNDI